jgi:hypothetical protein
MSGSPYGPLTRENETTDFISKTQLNAKTFMISLLHDDAEFRLLRMVLLDSYSPGSEVIINLRNGAIVTGENGSGKTSLIRLIPIFFGENPGRITVGTESFANFYLARTTSYIIFEYARRDVVCQAVLYAGQDESYAFRFIRNAYDLTQYAGTDGRSLIQSHALSTHLKTMGVSFSRALALSEYRAIIQGKPGAGKEAAQQRAYVNDYALTSGIHRLDHIDKIVSGMFKRQADFNAFLRMVISYITDEDRPISVSGDRNRIGKWPDHYAAYQEVMGHSERMGEINTLGARLVANDSALSVLHAKFLVLIEYHQNQHRNLQAAHAADTDTLESEESKHLTKLASIQDKESAAAGEATIAEGAVNALRQQAEAYEGQNIAAKAKVVAHLEDNRELVKQRLERRETLLGNRSGIVQTYEKLTLEVEQAFMAKQSAFMTRTQEIEASFVPRVAELDATEKQALQELRDSAESTLAEKREELGKVIAAEAHWKAIASNPPASFEAEQAVKKKRDDLHLARNAFANAEQAFKGAGKESMDAIKAFERQDNAAKEAAGLLNKQQAAIDKLIASSEPAEGSLLRFLREHHPGWTHDIAKTIDPELLHQTNLSPSIRDNPGSLYGLSIDLSRLHTPTFADEAALQREIESARSKLAGFLQLSKDADARLSTLNTAREVAQGKLNEMEGVAEAARSLVAALVSDEQSAANGVEASKRAAQATALENEKEAKDQVTALQGAITGIQSQSKKALGAVEEEFKGRRRGLGNEKAILLKQLAEEMTEASQKKEMRIKELQAERDGILDKEGVDTARLQELEEAIKEAEEAVKQAVNWAEAVAQWKLWLQNERPRIATEEARAVELRKKAKHHRDSREAEQKLWSESHAKETKRLKAMAEGAERSRITAQDARTKLVRIEAFVPDEKTSSSHYEPVWTVEALVGQMNSLFFERHGDEAGLKARIREIKLAFRNGRGSPTEQYFEATAANIDPDDDNPRAWIEPLRDWYGSRHEEFLRTLLLEAQSFGRLINRFYGELTEFDREIKSFNRSMRTAITKTIVFKRISQISIEFISTVDKKAYWKPIKDFVDTHHSWISSLGNELPPPTFSEGLKRLMEHWEVREGIRADRMSLIDVRGEVVENGKLKSFVDGPGLSELSSNGLSYLILTTICVAFLRMIRGDAKVQLTMAVDELLDLDVRNIGILVQMLRENGIDLVSACPDADVDVMIHFENRYKVVREESGPEIHQAELVDEEAFR